MTNFRRAFISAPLFGIIATVWVAPAAAQQVVLVPAGTTRTTPIAVGGADRVTVETGATLTSTSNPTINWSTASTDLQITNAGTVSSTAADGRAINASGSGNPRSITLNNLAGAVIQSENDAFRINVNVTSGTIVINNAGTIRTTVGGQALDFDAIAAGTASVTINNLAGGVISAVGQDAIRPGQGAVVNNAGTIRSDGAANNSYDGIDWQQRSGVINNAATGVISGLRHGTTSDVDVNVTNAGTITGRNGSGIGSDGTGTVVNTGTITGTWDGVATNGDGDGVDIDFIGTVRNSGTIQGLTATGVDSGGRPNSAEGVAMGGGLIENTGTIFGGARGVLINHDTNAGGVADGVTTIVNAGTIRGGTAQGIQLVGTFNDTITNSGIISGGNQIAIDMGDGDDTLNLLAGSAIIGAAVGGAGTDVVTLNANALASGSFAGAVQFERLDVRSGNWTLTAGSTFADGTTIASGASLTGNTTTLTGAYANSGTLVFDQATSGSFAGSLTGAGALVKTGAGTLSIGTQTGFTGATLVSAGRLNVLGTLTSAVTVATGGTLGGTGTLGSVLVQSGGTISPGASIGTLTVTGNFIQASGSSFVAETAGGGTADRITVGGTATIQNGATLVLTRDAAAYTIGTSYTLLTAAGGITGSYSIVTQTSSNGTEFRQRVTGNSLFVDVARTAQALAAFGGTPNQAGTARGLAATGVGNAAFAALTLIPGDAAVRAGLDSLSGEVHASVRTALIKDAQRAQDAVIGRLIGEEPEGVTLWGQFTGGQGVDKSKDGGIARVERDTIGGFGGVEGRFGETIVAGLGGGYTSTKLDLAARASSAKAKSYHIFGYAGAGFGPIRLKAAIGYGMGDIDTRRSVAFAGFADAPRASYDAYVLHGLAEASYATEFGQVTLEPFARLAAVRTTTERFAEAGGAAALSGARNRDTVIISTIGVRGEAALAETFALRGGIGWQHGYDDVSPDATVRFAGSGTAFTVSGAPIYRDAAVPTLDLVWKATKTVRLSAGYAGAFGDNGHDHVGRATVSFEF